MELALLTLTVADRELFVPRSPTMDQNAQNLAQTSLGGSAVSARDNLDVQGNPLLARFTTERDRRLASLPPVTDVDWRGNKAKDCKGAGQLRAAQVQRVGITAPDGCACVSCGKGFGPFATCRVLILDGEPWFSGACANCSFNAGGKGCSFRKCPSFLTLSRTFANSCR